MAKFVGKPTISFTVHVELSESEARALDALVGYGFDAFLKHFKESLGTAYIRDHEGGLRSLFESVHGEVGFQLDAVNKAREAVGLRKVFPGE